MRRLERNEKIVPVFRSVGPLLRQAGHRSGEVLRERSPLRAERPLIALVRVQILRIERGVFGRHGKAVVGERHIDRDGNSRLYRTPRSA